MKKTFARFGLLLLIVGILASITAPIALAQGGTKQVGLVVRFSDGHEHMEIVTVPADASATAVLQRSSLPVEVDDSSGWGNALCRIGPDGCPATNCFCSTEFWAFWVPNSAGSGWDASMVGIDGYNPAHGTVIGFSWTASDENWNPIYKPGFFSFNYILEIPEPATLLLLGGGLAGMAGYLGLRRRAR